MGIKSALKVGSRRVQTARVRFALLKAQKLKSKPSPKDTSDWMLNRSEFLKWQRELGVTFSVDACCDPDGFNSHVPTRFYSKDKSFLQADVSGETVWCNPPFHSAVTFLSHYLQCKSTAPWSTSGVFILPKWRNPKWANLTQGMRLLHEYPAHTQLFTRPNADPALDRVQVGPAPWPVQVFYDPPVPSSITNISLDNLPSTSGSSPPSQYPPELSSPSPSNISTQPNSSSLLSSYTDQVPNPQFQTECPSPLHASTTALTTSLPTTIPSNSSVSLLSHPLFTQTDKLCSLSSKPEPDMAEQLIVFDCLVQGKPARAMLDSGATRNFLSHSFVHQHKLPTSTLQHPLRVRLADGSIMKTAECIPSASFMVGDYSEELDLVLAQIDAFDLILGKPWLTKHNPTIVWSTNTIITPFTLTGFTTQRPPAQVKLLDAQKMAKTLSKLQRANNPGEFSFLATVQELQSFIDPEPPDPPDLSNPSDSLSSTTVQPPNTISPFPTALPEPVGDASAPPPDPLSPTTDLPPTVEQTYCKMLQDRRQYFEEPTGMPKPGKPNFSITLKPGYKVPDQRTYRMSPAELEEVQRQLKIYLERGWVRPSQSEFGAPILFVRKKDGTLRMCIDYRQLNAISVPNKYPLPRIDELLDQLHGAKYFTSLDLWSGYHQMAVDPASQDYTSFRTRYGLYAFTVLPFGLSGAPSAFMELMNNVLKPYLDKFVVVFLDDCCIYSRTAEEHVEHVRLVLDALNEAGLKVKASKCDFARNSVGFLGFLVTSEGLKVDPKKIEAVTKWLPPSDLHGVRSFLGFCNFYRRFVKDFATIASPLTDLTKSTVPFPSSLPSSALDAFRKLQSALTSAPVLTIPFTGPDSTFELYTDASGVGIGAVLSQDQGVGPQPVAFESRKLSPAERNYPVHEQELLAVVHAVKTFRHYLEGCKSFTLFTDHRSLIYFLNQKDLSRRQARWAMDLATYQPNLKIEYKPGPQNQADFLSRYFPEASPATISTLCSSLSDYLLCDSDTLSTLSPHLYSLQPHYLSVSDSLLTDISQAYEDDPYYSSKLPSFLTFSPSDNLWRFKDRVCVPKSSALRLKILQEYHDAPTAGHPGYEKTLQALANRFWWPRMTRSIRSYVNSCPTCQRIKPSTQSPPGLLQPHSVPVRPYSHLSFDLITDLPPSVGPDGCTYTAVASFVCMLTKKAVFARTNKTISSKDLAHLYLEHVFRPHGLSTVLVSDRDPRINSDFWRTLFSALGSKLNMSTSHHPQTDGNTERVHRTIEQILRAYVHPLHDDWATWLPVAEFAYNNSYHSSLKTTPFYANYGYHPSTPASLSTPNSTDSNDHQYLDRISSIQDLVKRELELVKAQQAEQANKHRRHLTFNPGDMARLSTDFIVLPQQPSKKFRPRFVGPFKVLEVVSPVSFRLQLPKSMSKVHPVFHVSRLLPWTANDDSEFPGRVLPDAPTPIAEEYIFGDDVYTVSKILGVRLESVSGKPSLQFLVRWSAPWQDPSNDTWEPYSNLNKLTAMQQYIKSRAFSKFAATQPYKAYVASIPAKHRSETVPRVVMFLC